MIGSPAIVRLCFLCFALLLGCGKPSQAATNQPSSASNPAPADALDRATTMLLEALASGDYEGLRTKTVDPLTGDLSRAEFDDVAAIVQWLGPLQHREATKTDETYGGGERRYTLQFERGAELQLDVSLDADGKLIGFHFSGEGYLEGEHGVLAEPWREFKVYDFAFVDAEGTPLEEDTPIAGTRVAYEVVVGGIEAFIGEHHLTIEKIVLDAAGKEVFHEPIEFDVRFAADALGIPRGLVRGHLEVPGPGEWEMQLEITDRNANRDIDYRRKFETVP